MKNKFTGYIPVFLLTMILFHIGSCVPQACLENMEATAKSSFYITGTGKKQAPDSVTLYGLGRDTSKIYDKALKPETIKIPLDAGSDTCRFIMKINGIEDTVTFIYTSYPYLISKECGYTFFHSVDVITNTRKGVDFLIINRNINNVNEENIRIFY